MTTETTTAEQFQFQAEVSRLLEIVAHALYSEREVFLRELVSNAADACDKRRYLALTDPGLALPDGQDYAITLQADKDAKTLTVTDNGIGMNRDDLIENLGTIAKSGTSAFLQAIKDKQNDVSLIGQFGVGFYAAFMVADHVDVISRKAGEAGAYKWSSDGKGAFTLGEADRATPGTDIILHMKADATEFLDPADIRRIITRYSDHVPLPIRLQTGEDATLINKASALWTRSRNDINDEEYKAFYQHIAQAWDDPWMTFHWHAEGMLDYYNLLYIPTMKPMDLYDPHRQHKVRLYVKRVFITDTAEGLIPPYLRFLRGVVDSQDLALNISREMLQNNPVVRKIRNGITKKVLGDLARRAEEGPENYALFWSSFGAVLKEGLYEDNDHRDLLFKACRFRSTWSVSQTQFLTSLDDYVSRMKDGQEAIYYITGDDFEAVKESPHLEGFRSRGIEVLLFTDGIDEFWTPAVGTYQDKPFKSVTRAGTDLSKMDKAGDGAQEEEPPKPSDAVESLLKMMKDVLQDEVKDVRISPRLTDSPVCLVSDETDMDMYMERLLKQHRQLDQAVKRILEINATHPLITALATRAAAEAGQPLLEDAAWLLLDQARIVDGESIPDPVSFAKRLSALMQQGLTAEAA